MPKKEFQTQHYYLKWICAFPLLFIALLIQFFISQHTDSDIIFYLACAAVIGGLLSAYYLIVAKLHLFEYKGYFWEDSELVVIEIGKRKYEISDVRSLSRRRTECFYLSICLFADRDPKRKGQNIWADASWEHGICRFGSIPAVSAYS